MNLRDEFWKRKSVKKVLLVAIALFVVHLAEAAEPFVPWKKIGTVKSRHAKEIESSNWSVGAETIDRDYTIYRNWKDYLGPLGVKKARIQGGWAKTEKSKGVYDFAWLDEVIFDMNDQGVEPWMCLCYGNSLYSEGGGVRLGAQIPSSEDSLRAWTKWVEATVKRYMSIIDEWEIWNEPDLRGSNAAQTYARFMLHTAENIRQVQPKAKILTMSTAGVNTKFVADVLKIAQQQDKVHLVDQVTYHPYNRNPDKSYEAVTELRKTVKSFSQHITIRQGENGCPSMRRKTKALSGYDWTEVSQAKWALRRLLGDFGRDIESSYFSIMDMKYPDEMNAKGLLRSRQDQTVEYAKPSYYAVRNLTSIFDDRLVRAEDFSFTAASERPLSVFAYRDKRSGCSIVAVWLESDVPSDSNRKTAVDFDFMGGRFERPVYVDLRTGEVFEIPESAYVARGNEYTFREIMCYDSPILIAERANIYVDE